MIIRPNHDGPLHDLPGAADITTPEEQSIGTVDTVRLTLNVMVLLRDTAGTIPTGIPRTVCYACGAR